MRDEVDKTSPLRAQAQRVLEEEVKPALALHGGSVELIDVTPDNVVKVKLTGACAGCPMAQLTILSIVEKTIKARIPEIKQVTVWELL